MIEFFAVPEVSAYSLQKPSAGFHREDIDGLRAVAVLLVLAGHFGVRHFSGGFIGVDIFFVISGYLISTILLRDLNAGRFSAAAFYERRLRRIFPALFAMLVATCVASWVLLFPLDFHDFAHSLIAAALSYSNIYFWQQSGYFDPSSLRRPLLHTWSLSVEEQFYIVFPPLLYLVHRYARQTLRIVVLMLAAASFLASAVLVFRYPSAMFYLAPARAWELLLGTMLALGIVKSPQTRAMRNVAGVTGALLLLAGIVLIGEQTPFPGAAALFPCIGALLLLLSGTYGDTVTARVLAWKPIAFIGLISYSLYLWHWPLVVLRQYGFKEQIVLRPIYTQMLMLIESLLLGYLSWKFIETPFRTRSRISRSNLFATTGTLSAALILFAIFILRDTALNRGFSPEAIRLASLVNYGGNMKLYRADQCFITHEGSMFDESVCLASAPGKPLWVLAGTSHAAHLWPGLSTVYPEVSVLQITGGCGAPVLHLPAGSPQYCTALNQLLFRVFLPTHKVDAVILSYAWLEASMGPLNETLTYLDTLHIPAYIVGPVMEYNLPLPELLARNLGSRDPAAVTRHLDPAWFSRDALTAAVVARHPNDHYVSVIDLMCPGHICVTYAAPGLPVQADQSHLTQEGSILLAQRIRAADLLPLH
jgi:peptidoglycan/LPS O-acetylase OafA/YrhL